MRSGRASGYGVVALQTYTKVWQILEELTLEYKRRGKTVPQEIIDDLKSAKTMIAVYERDPSYPENVLQVESLLGKIEANLLYIAEADFGRAFADGYQKRILDARLVTQEKKTAPPSRFIPGIPSGEHWIRFKPTDAAERRDVEELARSLGLSSRLERNGSLILHGDEKKIKDLVQKIAEKAGKAKKK